MTAAATAGPFFVRNVTRGSLLAGRVVSGAGFWGAFRGLMGRPPLATDEGLWLPGVNNIHMLFMRFPIDAVFVTAATGDGSRTVTRVVADLPPWRGVVWWAKGAKGVLELAAGAAAASGTRAGDRVTFESGPSDRPDARRPA